LTLSFTFVFQFSGFYDPAIGLRRLGILGLSLACEKIFLLVGKSGSKTVACDLWFVKLGHWKNKINYDVSKYSKSTIDLRYFWLNEFNPCLFAGNKRINYINCANFVLFENKAKNYLPQNSSTTKFALKNVSLISCLRYFVFRKFIDKIIVISCFGLTPMSAQIEESMKIILKYDQRP